MSNIREFRDLEAQGVDIVELLAGDRTLAPREFLEIVNRVKSADEDLYGDLLYLLTHHRFAAADTRSIWRSIVKHKRRMAARLGRNPGIRLAALDYLTNIRDLIKWPRIVDRGDFDRLVGHVNSDDLTGLFNRRHMNEAFRRELRRSRRYSKALTVMLIDVENFKAVNDTYGHPAGDKVLVELARLLGEVCRETDIIGRYGGDEILVLLPEARKRDAFALAERLRRAARDREILAGEDGKQRIQISLSIGLATYPDDSQETEELLRCADDALYQSKHRGRDVVSIYDRARSARGGQGAQAREQGGG
ncbi:MAG: GGDEF domain-containing protein [Planctomycetota bacterium]